MRRVLNDDQYEEQFQKDGYVQIPFLNAEEVKELQQLYFDTLPNSGGRFRADEISYDFTFIDKNIDYKRQVFDIITKRFEEHVKEYLADYKPIIANFIRKQPEDGEVPMHQNWAFVDERKCTSVSIWCPLVDSNEANGTLQVVPGTQKRYGEVRGPMIPWELENIKEEIIANDMVPMNIKAGEAVVLCDSIVHYSNINATQGLRLAIQLILIPSEEPSIHYHMDLSQDKQRVDVLEVDTEFYMNFNPWKKPENVKCVRSFKYKPFDMNYKTFEEKIYGPRIDEPIQRKSFIKRIKEALS